MHSISAKLKIAVVQLAVSASKTDNLNRASKLISQAAREGAKLIALPECFNSPYGNQYFKTYAEAIPGESSSVLSNLAKENEIYLIGGSIPEVDKEKYYNSCLIYGPSGELIDKFRKLHLFDIDVPNKITMKESDTLTPGDKLTEFVTPFCKVGVGICYDLRFAELGQIYAQRDCKLLVYPGAFNMTTGPAHWKILQQGRAVDNQVYVASASPARDEKATYVAWGHSMITSPWGETLGELDEKEGILYADLDFNFVDQVRQQIPIRNQKRNDIYEVKCKI